MGSCTWTSLHGQKVLIWPSFTKTPPPYYTFLFYLLLMSPEKIPFPFVLLSKPHISFGTGGSLPLSLTQFPFCVFSHLQTTMETHTFHSQSQSQCPWCLCPIYNHSSSVSPSIGFLPHPIIPPCQAFLLPITFQLSHFLYFILSTSQLNPAHRSGNVPCVYSSTVPGQPKTPTPSPLKTLNPPPLFHNSSISVTSFHSHILSFMGCTTSKQARRDLRRSPSPLPRSRSMPHHPRVGGANPSATLGSLMYGPPAPDTDVRSKDLSTELVKAKAWSAMIEKRIQTTPTETPPDEPETIDTCELMAGLDDSSPLRPPTPTFDRHSFSFYTTRNVEPVSASKLSSKLSNGAASPGPIITAADFDPVIISNFRKALEELSPQLRSPESVKTASRLKNRCAESTGIVRGRIDAFQEIIDAKKDNAAKISQCRKCPSGGESKVVLYFTSLRGVRKTYEECHLVRMILRGYEVCIDERDVSMDRGFRDELTEFLGTEYGGSWLPRVFANGRDLGGAEEVRWLHESGELGKALEDCAKAFVGKGGRGGPCQECGDVRFVLCGRCSGSCKVWLEEEMEEEEEEDEEEEWGDVECGFRRCPACNENGLVRCPVCC